MIQRVCDRDGCLNEFGGRCEVNPDNPKVFKFVIGSEDAVVDVNTTIVGVREIDLCDDCAELLEDAISDPDTVKAIFKMLKARRTRGNSKD